jgi:hypothetical protein
VTPAAIRRRELRVRRNGAALARLTDGSAPGQDPALPVPFLCECVCEGCQSFAVLPLDAYRTLRDRAGHFVVCPGHERPELEHALERGADHVVVAARA